MIQNETILNVADNSGAKKILCIRVMGGSRRKAGHVGDIIIASVKEAAPGGAVKKGEIVRAVIVRTKSRLNRKDGSHIHFDENAAVIINEQNNPRGTQILDLLPGSCAKRNS